jgi:gamma-glutamyltranspeptidase / glutathione hydrolase
MKMFFILLFLIFGCSPKLRLVSFPDKEHQASSQHFMATTQGPATTQSALWAINQGGNIIDAFVSASLSISVERPHSTGIGGGGFLLFYSKKSNQVLAFDFRETSPSASQEKMYLDSKGAPREKLSIDGALAVATPGLIRGLFEIHQKYGKLPWGELFKPAIQLAEHGFPLYRELQVAIEDRQKVLLKDSEAREIFFTKDLKVPPLGSQIVQKNLSLTLKLIAEKGEQGFYSGPVAKNIVNTIKKKNGILSLDDLKNYQMKTRTPVSVDYKGLQIFSMPPPSSGGIHVLQILSMLSHHELDTNSPQSAKNIHLIANAMQLAFQDRAKYMGDPDFNHLKYENLLNKDYIKKLSQEISSPLKVSSDKLKDFSFPYESSETTHFSLADEEGNVVASTQTINGWFGSGVIADGTGIILNNEMDDFAQKVGASNLFGAVGGEYNLIQPRKRPLSSMSPTIILSGQNPVMALGSPSGTRIITCVAQTILNVFEFKMPLDQAVSATRIHHQWKPDLLKIEAPYLSEEEEKKLTDLGHQLSHEKLGCSVQALMKHGKEWIGVSDPRGQGKASGL